MFKKNSEMEDERVKSIRQQINSEAFSIVFFLLMISFFVKSVILDLPFREFAAEFAIFLIASIYVSLRSVLQGVFVFSNNTKKRARKQIVISSVISGLVAGLLTGLINYIKYDFDLKMLSGIVSIISFEIVAIMLVMFFVLTKWSNRQADKQVEDED